jgi:putative SOS response-associated peptidase YedK
MCSNYKAVTNLDHLVSFFGISRDFKGAPPEFASDVWPLGLAPMIRLDELGRRRVETGQFGLLPHFAKERVFGRKTYNARSETVHSKPSFRDAWKRSQRCIVPAYLVYEQCYETGRAVRHAIEQPSGAPMGIAGIYTDHPTLTRSSGEPVISFAMLTVNADGHPVFSRMHGPEDEKRMPVILDPADYDQWLTCAPEEAAELFKQWRGPLRDYPAPLPPRKKKTKDAGDGDAPIPIGDDFR